MNILGLISQLIGIKTLRLTHSTQLILSCFRQVLKKNQILRDTFLHNCCNMRRAVRVQDHIMLPRKLADDIDKSFSWCSPSIPMQL